MYLAAYEKGIREFVELNQARVSAGDAALFPRTEEALAQRNAALRRLAALPAEAERPEHSALVLPDYDWN